MSTEVWTIGRLLQWTTDFLKQRGAESPRLDAEVLLAFARGCERIELYTAFEEAADETLRTRFRELVKRRADGMPVAYLVGRREFYSLAFEVTPDVLIPRPETEHLVVALLDQAKALGSQGDVDIVDVGTGSGIISVCAARRLPASRVVAVDISPAALAVARRNAARHGVADRIEFMPSDLLSDVPSERRFHMVASNPPYVSDEEMSRLPREVREHEPALALSAGPSGLAVIERLVPQTAERLHPGGWLLLEISPMIHDAVRHLIAAHGAFELAPTIKDLAGLQRVVQAHKR